MVKFGLESTFGKDKNNNPELNHEAYTDDEVYVEEAENCSRQLRSSDKKMLVIPSCLDVDDDLKLGLYFKLVEGKVKNEFRIRILFLISLSSNNMILNLDVLKNLNYNIIKVSIETNLNIFTIPIM